MTVRRTRLKKAAPASFLTHIIVRQFPYEDRRVPRPYPDQIILPGNDPFRNLQVGKYRGKKVTV
jgi:hypothetical protein